MLVDTARMPKPIASVTVGQFVRLGVSQVPLGLMVGKGMLWVARLGRAQDTNTNRTWTFTGEHSFVSLKKVECIFPVTSENEGTIEDSLLVSLPGSSELKSKTSPDPLLCLTACRPVLSFSFL